MNAFGSHLGERPMDALPLSPPSLPRPPLPSLSSPSLHVPIPCSDFHSSEHLRFTGEHLNKRPVNSIQLLIFCYLHGRLDSTYCVPACRRLEVSLCVPEVQTQALKGVVKGRLPPPYLPAKKTEALAITGKNCWKN